MRRAAAGETLTTLDDVERRLDPDDLLITDDSGPIGLAGVMGGASHRDRVRPARAARSTSLLEAAHWDPAVDRPRRPPAQAAQRGVAPLRAGASTRSCRRWPPSAPRSCSSSTAAARSPPAAPTSARAPAAAPVRMPLDLPDRVAGVAYAPRATVRRLQPGRLQRRARHRRRRPRPRRGHPAVLAAGPRAARRPGRGGAAAGGLRHHPVGAARRPARARPHRGPAAPPRRVPGAGRGRLRRGAAVPVRRSRRSGTRSACPPTTSAAAPCTCSTRWTPTAPSSPPRCCPACWTRWCATGPAGVADLALLHIEQVVLPHATAGRRCRTRPSPTGRRTPRSRRSRRRCRPSRCTSPSVLAGDRERRGLVGPGSARPAGPTRSQAGRLVGQPRRASSCG